MPCSPVSELVDDVVADGDGAEVEAQVDVAFTGPVDAMVGNNWPFLGDAALDVGNHGRHRRLAAGEQNIDITTTEMYADWKKRKPRWSESMLRWFVQGKHNTVKSIMEEGLKEPILVQKDSLKLSDGGHRLIILKTLGYETVIVREL